MQKPSRFPSQAWAHTEDQQFIGLPSGHTLTAGTLCSRGKEEGIQFKMCIYIFALFLYSKHWTKAGWTWLDGLELLLKGCFAAGWLAIAYAQTARLQECIEVDWPLVATSNRHI